MVETPEARLRRVTSETINKWGVSEKVGRSLLMRRTSDQRLADAAQQGVAVSQEDGPA